MTPQELALRVGAVLEGLTTTVTYDQVGVVLPRERWVAGVTAVRDDVSLA